MKKNINKTPSEVDYQEGQIVIKPGIEELPEISGSQFKYICKYSRAKKEIAQSVIKSSGNSIQTESLNHYNKLKEKQIPAHLKLILIDVLGVHTLNSLLTEFEKQNIKNK
jgi:hypothetical protein